MFIDDNIQIIELTNRDEDSEEWKELNIYIIINN